ncbi:MAG: hypothetical protein KME31_15280 [Tolypothrix carrinoi HA7290-LM1]|nr:hypothetical protein [Tolypothrix carrinoi HA7290-LM1]
MQVRFIGGIKARCLATSPSPDGDATRTGWCSRSWGKPRQVTAGASSRRSRPTHCLLYAGEPVHPSGSAVPHRREPRPSGAASPHCLPLALASPFGRRPRCFTATRLRLKTNNLK